MEKVTQQIKQYSKCGKIVFSKKRKVFSLSDRTDISLSLSEIVTRNGGKKDFISRLHPHKFSRSYVWYQILLIAVFLGHPFTITESKM